MLNKRKPVILASVAICFLLIGLFCFFYFFPSFDRRLILTNRMAPGLEKGNQVIVKRDFDPKQLRRGDIICYYPPERLLQSVPEEERDIAVFIERIVGLPGETVAVQRGVGVIVNGKPLIEAYPVTKPNFERKAEKLPNDAVFVLPDNRAEQKDEITGVVHFSEIHSRFCTRIWPLDLREVISDRSGKI